MIRRRAGLALAALVAAALLGCGSSESAPERIVLVSIDTLRADHVGAYGSTEGATPSLDALAASGVVFLDALSPAPITLPSHATLLTGLDPPAHGVHHNGIFELAGDLPFLPQTLREAGFATGGFVGAVVLDRQYGLARGFDRYGDQMALRHASEAGGYAERRASEVVEEALAWTAETDGHFFLWVHLYDPHADYDPPGAWRERFADPYLGEIGYADSHVGRLIRQIRQRWPDDRTLFVVTSDHGESRGEHGELTHGYGIYQATQHVPLILAGPHGLPAGTVVTTPVRLADVAPTVIGLAGLLPSEGLDGRDLRPVIRGLETAPRVAYLETLLPGFDHGWSNLYGIRNGRFKYLRAPEPELYDLESDPDEAVNLAFSQPERVAELESLLEERLAGARPVTPNDGLGDQRRAQLARLGYLPAEGTGPVALGEVGGLHPREGLGRVADWMRGNTLLARGRLEEARESLENAGLDAPIVDLDRAEAAVRAGDGAAAERFARAAGDHPRASLLLGEALLVQGRFDEAERAFREAAERLPAEGEPWVGLGRVEEARGHREQAAELYQRATEGRAPSSEGYWRLAALRIEDGQREEGSALLSKMPANEPLPPRGAVRLARAELRAGNPQGARLHVAMALQRYPEADELLALRATLADGTTGGRDLRDGRAGQPE